MSIMRWLFLCGLCYSGSVLSAVSCNSIFPGPAQSFSAYSSDKSKNLEPGTLYMQSGAAIKNYAGNNLCFENVQGYDSEMSNAACADGSSKCNITGVHSSALKTPSFPTNSDSNNSYVIADWGYKKPVLGSTTSLGKYNTATGNWDVGALTINDDSGNGSLYFSNNYKNYVISSITFNNNGKMILNAGSTYYILGDLNLNSGLISITGDNTKTTNIYINGSLTVNNSSTLTSNGKLFVYVSSNLNINGSSSTIGGSYYVNGDAVFWNSSVLNGVISAKSLTLGGSSRINYAADTTQSSQSSNINHYEIRYPDSQITCEPAAITINACTNTDTSSCTKDTTVSSSVTLSAPTSGWSSNPVTLTNGSGSVSLNHYAVGNVTLGLSSASYTCFKNGVVDSACQLPFVASAFSFDFPTFYAGSNSGNVTLKAVQASASNPAVCTSLFANKTQNVTFASQYILPGSGTLLPTLNGSSLNSNTAAVTLPLAFDSTGVASLNLAYNDAGVLGITAQTTLSNSAGETLSVSGSDNVAVLPAKILLSAADQTACTESYADCAVYKTVGQSFILSAKAGYLSGSSWNTTANFSTSQLAASALLLLQHQLVAPSTGTLPALASTSLSFTAGTASASLSESDVGVYQYGVTDFVPYSAYQNESPQKTVPLSWSDPVGRFIPAKLQAAVITQGTLTTDTCLNNSINAALGYTGQALSFATMPTLSVTALGSDGSTVMKNYQGAFAKITSATPSGSGAFTANLLPKNNVNSLTSLASWAAGSWSTLTNAYNLLYSFGADDRFTFTKTNTNQVAPFETSLTISALADSDGVSASSLPLNLLPMAPDASAFKVYSGRLTLESVNGAENNGLVLPFYMQYWNGSAYAINSADNCTSLTSNALQMNNQTNWTGIPLRVASASNSVATTTASLSPAKVSSGVGFISFTAPNASGWVDIAASSSLPDWMKDFTLPSGLTPARASFGYYHGNDRLIYRREVFGGQ